MKQTTHPDHPGTTASVKSLAAIARDIGGAVIGVQLTLVDADSHTGHERLGHRETRRLQPRRSRLVPTSAGIPPPAGRR
jgi:hypothetical protein